MNYSLICTLILRLTSDTFVSVSREESTIVTQRNWTYSYETGRTSAFWEVLHWTVPCFV